MTRDDLNKEAERVLWDRLTAEQRLMVEKLNVLPSELLAESGLPTPTTLPNTTPSSGFRSLATEADRICWDKMTDLQRRIATTLGVSPVEFMAAEGGK